MQKFLPVLVDVWRLACLRPSLADFTAGLFDSLQLRLRLTGAQLFAIDRQACCLRRVGSAGSEKTRGDPPPPPPAQWPALLAWCAEPHVLSADAASVRRQFPWLLPARCNGPLLVLGLALEGSPLGVLVLEGLVDAGADTGHGLLAEALREPVAVALRNAESMQDCERRREAAEADRRSLLARLDRQDISDSIVGAQSGLKDVMRRVDLVARADAPVLILGETGSGKEVVARAVHGCSGRSEGPFMRVNCGAIPQELADSELFGHERGSFTGATERRKGWFERADGGTLFLDEIGELPKGVQVRLLRILQDGSYERVGGQQALRVNVRVIAATHRDLPAMVREGAFREDLWYRINVFPIRLPALRERPEDIPDLAAHFALRAAHRLGLVPRVPNQEDLARLLQYHWPGNVRELAAVIERAAILGEGKSLAIDQAMGGAHHPVRPEAKPDDPPSPETLDAVEIRHIEQVLARCRGRIEGPFGAARVLDINPHTLRSRMRRLGIDWKRYRRG